MDDLDDDYLLDDLPDDAALDAAELRHDPVRFCRDVLGESMWAKQAEIAEALLKPPHRVLVKSANGVGKSWLAAALCTWFYLTRDPSAVVLTAPTARQVGDITFKEIKRLYGNRPGILPKAPRIEDHPGHLLTGFTANDATSFQGIHEQAILAVFEECVGIDEDFWTAARGIMVGGETYWLAICNPTDTSSHAYTEEMSGAWAVISVSAFEHPNVAAELQGLDPPIPSAVRLQQLASNMDDWGEWVQEGDELPTDVDLLDPTTYGMESIPPAMDHGIHQGFPSRFWRPDPIGEARICGRYPAQSAYSVFSEAAFDKAGRSRDQLQPHEPVTIGCDVARFGDDATTIHVRQGNLSLEHRSYRKQDTVQTANVLKELARHYARRTGVPPYSVPVLIDDDGVGGGVVDQAHSDPTPEDRASGDKNREQGFRFNFIPVRSGRTPHEEGKYPNVRSELLFTLAERLAMGFISLSALPEETRQELRRQAVSITYKLDAAGRRVAEAKHSIKARLSRSPDDLDAMALAYYPFAAGTWLRPGPKVVVNRPNAVRRMSDAQNPQQYRMGPPGTPMGPTGLPETAPVPHKPPQRRTMFNRDRTRRTMFNR